ncbi:MAG TPA: CvpA family protein [Candidatus Krumholzibacteria bacterium]
MDGATIASIVTLGIIAIGTISGGLKGFARQIIELVGLVVSFLVAAVVGSWVASFLSANGSVPHAATLVVAFIVFFVAGLVAFHFVAIAAQKLIHTTLLGWLDRACGAALGLVATTLLVSIMLTMAYDLPLSGDLRRAFDSSTVVNFVQPIAGWLFDLVIPHGHDGNIA